MFNNRSTAGEKNPNAKLTDEQYRHLQSLRGTMHCSEAAKLFDVSTSTVRVWWKKAGQHATN